MKMTTREGTQIEMDEAAVAELRAQLHGSLLCPGEPGYDEAGGIGSSRPRARSPPRWRYGPCQPLQSCQRRFMTRT